MVVNLMQGMNAWLSSTNLNLAGLHLSWLSLWTVLAQHIDDPDLLGQVQRAFDNFVQTGQVWALLTGLIIGYLIRGLTTYG